MCVLDLYVLVRVRLLQFFSVCLLSCVSACSSSCVCLLSCACVCVFDDVCVCVFVCVFLWLAPASLPPFPIRPHGSLPLVCLQRLHLSKKKRKRANIDQIMCRCCVCVLCLVACKRVCEFLYICERVPRWHSSLAFIQRITLHTLCEAATIDIQTEVKDLGSDEKTLFLTMSFTLLAHCCTRLSVGMSWD